MNDAPVAVNDSAATDEGVAAVVAVFQNDSDVDGDTLSITSFTQGDHGTVTDNGNGTLTYTPAENYNGNDSFTYVISDGQGETASATVSLIVHPVNDAPTAVNDAVSTNEDTAVVVSVLDNDSDADDDSLSISAFTQGDHGIVTDNGNGTLTYTPAGNYHGGDSFTYTISDGNGGTASATVNVTVASVNDAPTAVNDSRRTTAIDTALTLDVLDNDSDVEGDSLTVTAASAAHGSVVINANGTLTYTPDSGYEGDDAVAYTISDGNGGTASATADVTVAAVTSPKLFTTVLAGIHTTEWQTVTLPETYDSMVVVATPVFTGFMPPLLTRVRNAGGNSFEIKVQRADNGTEEWTGASVNIVVAEAGQYTAAVHGITMEAVRFTSTLTDNSSSWVGEQRDYLNSYTSPVVLGQVMSANDADPSYFWTRGSSRSSAPDASNLRVGKSVGEDSNTTRADETIGYLVVEAGTGQVGDLTYSAGVGPDIVVGTVDGRYRYTIPGITSATSAVLTVAGLDDSDGAWAMLIGDDALAGSVIVLGVEEDNLGDGERSHPTESVGYFVFQSPNANRLPVANNDGPLVANRNEVLDNINVLANDTDGDDDPLTVTEASALHGTVTINADNTLKYVPDTGYEGADTITYSISDGRFGTDSAEVAVTVSQNNVPVANDESVLIEEDTPIVISVLANDTDADGDTLNFSSFAQGGHGSVRLNADGTLTYSPDRNYNGSDSFTYTINDGRGGTDSATVSVNITAVNDAPAAASDFAATEVDTPETILALSNDSDAEGDAIEITSFTDGAHGTVTANDDGTLEYTPDAGYVGDDSFTYVVSDEHGAASSATVRISVYEEGGYNDPDGHDMHDVLALTPVAQATFVSAGSGDWSDANTWVGGAVPGLNAKVHVAMGHTVVFDTVQTERTEWVRVDGTLQFDHTVDTRLHVETMVVGMMGTLLVGTADQPIGKDDPATPADESGVTAEIVIADAGEDFDHSVDVHELGRGLIPMGHVEMYGDTVTPYVALAVEPIAGATQLTLETAPEGWQVGDRLVITGSGRLQDETLFITGFSTDGEGRTVVSFDNDPDTAGAQGLVYNHTTPGYGIKIFVANMNRDISIRSENPDILNRRGHVMFMHNQSAEVVNAGFYELGRTNKAIAANDSHRNAEGELVAGTNQRGRYSLHFHIAGTSVAATPALVTGNVVDTSPGWGYVNHSSYVNMTNNVAYDVLGASFSAEIGDERGTFTRNLSIRNTGSGDHFTYHRGVQDLGHAGHGFYMEGTGVSLIDNIVTGSRRIGFVFHKNNTFASEFSGNMVYGTEIAVSMYKQLGDIVFEGLTTWTSGDALQFPYARRVTVRNSTLIGNPASPRGKAIDALVEQFYTDFDNNTIVGWETGLLPQGTGTVIIRGGYYANVKNIGITPAGGFHRQFEIHGTPQFETLTAAQLNGRVQEDYDMWPGVTGGDIDIESNFEAGQSLVLYNDQQMYWAEQASDYVPYPSGYPTPSWIPPELIDKTNQQIVDQYGLVPGGAIAPPDAVDVPRSDALIGARAEYLPSVTRVSAEYTNNLNGYILSYRTSDGTVVTETEPTVLRQGWNVLTREIGGRNRSLLVYGDITPPTILVGPVPPSVHYDSLSSGVKIKTLLSDNTFGARRLTLRYGDLSGHALEVDSAGQPYILVSASATDFAGNRTTRDIRVNVLSAWLESRL